MFSCLFAYQGILNSMPDTVNFTLSGSVYFFIFIHCLDLCLGVELSYMETVWPFITSFYDLVGVVFSLELIVSITEALHTYLHTLICYELWIFPVWLKEISIILSLSEQQALFPVIFVWFITWPHVVFSYLYVDLYLAEFWGRTFSRCPGLGPSTCLYSGTLN